MEEYNKWGLTINLAETNYLVINDYGQNTDVEFVDTVKYLRLKMTKKGINKKEIIKRIKKITDQR